MFLKDGVHARRGAGAAGRPELGPDAALGSQLVRGGWRGGWGLEGAGVVGWVVYMRLMAGRQCYMSLWFDISPHRGGV